MPPTTLAIRRPRQWLDQFDGVVRNLLGEFARRAKNQGAGGGGLEVAGVGRVLALGLLRRGFAAGSGFGGLALEFGLGFGFGFGLALEQRVQHGQQEGGGLARAGLAGDHQVDETGLAVLAGFTAHGERDHLVLHGGRLGEAQVGHGGDQFGCEAQTDEAVGQSGFFHHGDLGGGCVERLEDRRFGHSVHSGGEFVVGSGLHRRELALRFKSVGHVDINLKRERCRRRRPVGG
jgi:hypothetical protein